MSRFANKPTSYGIDSTLIINLTARRDDGRFWDLGTERGQRKIGANATRTPDRTLDWTHAMHDQERQHTRACIEAYKRQLIMGRHFLHEHPLHASSWCMPEMRELMNDGRVHLVQGPMCHWRLSSTGDGDNQEFVCGKTRWATSSSTLAALLARKHAGENRRVRLIGRSEMIAALMYSPKFVNETLRVLGKQLIDDERLDSVGLYSAGPTADFPELDTREWQEDDYDQQGN